MDYGNTAPAEPLVGVADTTLVARALVHEEAAAREIVRRYNQRLFRLARSVVHNDAEAEDVVQAGYVRAFTHLGSFRHEAQFGTWLSRIVLNEALGRLRRARPLTGLDQVEREQDTSAQIIQFPLQSTSPDPEAAMSRQEARALLERAIDGLPEAFRIVFVLREVEGLGTDEVAAQLMLRPETVNTRLFRARRLLRSAIAAELAPAFGALFPFDGARCVRMADRVIAELRRSAAGPGGSDAAHLA